MAADAFPPLRDLRLAGGPIRVYESGPPDAPVVMLLHGAMLDTAPLTWRHLLPALAAKWRVVAPDLPRHGGSRPWPGRLDQPALVAVADELLDRLKIERAALVGLSMGGGVAIGYALARPERVAGIAVINPGGVDDVRPFQLMTWLLLRSDRLLRLLTAIAARPAVLRSWIVKSLAHGVDTRDLDELMALAQAEARNKWIHRERVLDDWQIAAWGPWRMQLDLTPHLPELAVPSLWVHGREDTAIPGDAVRRAASLAPGGRFVEIEGAAHIATLDEPERVNELVAAFLADVIGG